MLAKHNLVVQKQVEKRIAQAIEVFVRPGLRAGFISHCTESEERVALDQHPRETSGLDAASLRDLFRPNRFQHSRSAYQLHEGLPEFGPLRVGSGRPRLFNHIAEAGSCRTR